MNKTPKRHSSSTAWSRAATKVSKVTGQKRSTVVSKKASKVVSRKSSKAAMRKAPKVLGTTFDGVRILKPRGRATHFTVPELEAAISRVRAARSAG
jgi:hypothetical protein